MGAALAVRRPVAVRGRRRAPPPVSGLGGLAESRPPQRGADVLAPSTGSVRSGCRSRRRGVAVAVLDARLHGRPVPAVPRCDQRRRDLRRRPLHPRHGQGRGPRQRPGRRHDRRRPQLSFQPSALRSQVGLPIGPARTAWPRGSRPASGCADRAQPTRLGRSGLGRSGLSRSAPAPARRPRRTGRSRAASRRRRPACRPRRRAARASPGSRRPTRA